MDIDRLLSRRARELDGSGIRRVFALAATMDDPINLSIGQPDFHVPDAVKDAAIKAIQDNHNGYTPSPGIPPLLKRCKDWIAEDLGWPSDNDAFQVCITAGTSGALFLMMAALLDGGDGEGPGEIIIPDPYFVAYEPMAKLAGGKAVICDTYPDFQMTAERLKPLITPRTKAVLLNSPGNPSGVVMSQEECRKVLELCRAKGVLLVSDEIYDEFTFDDHREVVNGKSCCPSPGREPGAHEDVLVIRGFGKTYGCTGWRMGYIAGPPAIVSQMAKLQQYTYVCPPAPLQHGCLATFDVDMTPTIEEYKARRDMVVSRLSAVTEVTNPGGAFYVFAKVPESLGITGTQFFERLADRGVLVIAGGVFSQRDTHIRISMAAPRERLAKGIDHIEVLMRGE